MNEKQAEVNQINNMMGRLVGHQQFIELSVDDCSWVIQNPKAAIALFMTAVRNRQVEDDLIKFLGTVPVPASDKPFVVRDNFKIDTSKKARIRIYFFNEMFEKEFLDKIEAPSVNSSIRYGRLHKYQASRPTVDFLGGEEKAETSLKEIFTLMEKQKKKQKRCTSHQQLGKHLFCAQYRRCSAYGACLLAWRCLGRFCVFGRRLG